MIGEHDWDVADLVEELDLAVRLHVGLESGRELSRDEVLPMLLVVHAPPVPDWFKPERPTRPVAPQLTDSGTRVNDAIDVLIRCGLDGCDLSALSDQERAEVLQYADFMDRRKSWAKDREAQRLAQWPWKYAEMVMEARPKPTGGAA